MDQTHSSILFPFADDTPMPTTTTTNERGTTAATRMTSMEKSRCSQQKPNILCASRDACLW